MEWPFCLLPSGGYAIIDPGLSLLCRVRRGHLVQREGKLKMPNYETMIILKPDLEAEAEEELIANLQSTIMKKGGTVDSVDDWGKRKLAYEINKFKEGHITRCDTGPQEITPELEHFYRVNDEVIRFIIVRKDQ